MVTLFSKLLFYHSVIYWSSSLCFNPTLSTELNDTSAWRIGVPVVQFVMTRFTTIACVKTIQNKTCLMHMHLNVTVWNTKPLRHTDQRLWRWFVTLLSNVLHHLWMRGLAATSPTRWEVFLLWMSPAWVTSPRFRWLALALSGKWCIAQLSFLCWQCWRCSGRQELSCSSGVLFNGFCVGCFTPRLTLILVLLAHVDSFLKTSVIGIGKGYPVWCQVCSNSVHVMAESQKTKLWKREISLSSFLQPSQLTAPMLVPNNG